MTLQRIIAILGSAVLASALISEPRAQADGDADRDRLSPQAMRALESTVHFAPDSAEIDPQVKQMLDDVVTWLRENPRRVVTVAGQTDEVEQQDYDRELANQRAQQIRQYLVSQGIDPGRIVTVAVGEEFPASDQPAENRRTVFYATQPGGMGYEQPPQVGDYGQQEGAEGYARPPVEDEDGDVLGIEPMEPVEEAEGFIARNGLSVSAGVGVMGFIGSGARGYTSPGGTWDVRLAFGTRNRIATEAAYFGVMQGIEATGLDDDARLRGQGFEANVRVNVMRRGNWQPYVLAGLGWTHYGLTNVQANTSNVQSGDNLLHIPLGIGVGYRIGSLLLGARATVRAAFGDELIGPPADGVGDGAADLSTWAAIGQVGWEF